jgi:hypothetical protein
VEGRGVLSRGQVHDAEVVADDPLERGQIHGPLLLVACVYVCKCGCVDEYNKMKRKERKVIDSPDRPRRPRACPCRRSTCRCCSTAARSWASAWPPRGTSPARRPCLEVIVLELLLVEVIQTDDFTRSVFFHPSFLEYRRLKLDIPTRKKPAASPIRRP